MRRNSATKAKQKIAEIINDEKIGNRYYFASCTPSSPKDEAVSPRIKKPKCAVASTNRSECTAPQVASEQTPIVAKQLTDEERQELYRKYDQIFANVLAHVASKTVVELLKEQCRFDGVEYVPIDEIYAADLNPYTCRMCKVTVIGHVALHRHLCLQHNGRKNETCDLCYRSWDGLREQYVCKICKEFFADLSKHEHRLFIDKPNKTFECDVCYEKFESLELTDLHQDQIHESRMVSCPECNKDIPERTIKMHITAHFSSVFTAIFNEISRMQRIPEMPLTQNQCPLCYKGLASASLLRSHIILQHIYKDDCLIETLGRDANLERLEKFREIVRCFGISVSRKSSVDFSVLDKVAKQEYCVAIKQEIVEEDVCGTLVTVKEERAL